MKFDKSFLNSWLTPALEKNKYIVLQSYPKAYFSDGFIYADERRMVDTRWDKNGVQAEYFAWLWALDFIEKELVHRLEQ